MMAAAAAAAAGLGAVAAAVEAAQRAAALKVYVPGNPQWCVALVPSCSYLVLRAANPADPEQRWEKNFVSDNSFELVNREWGMSIMNAHILPTILVDTAHFHPRLLRAPARWVEGVAAAGGGFADGGVDVVCVSVMRNHYLALKIAPWGHDQQGNVEMGAQAGDEVVAAVVKAENDDGAASDEDYAGAGAGAGAGEDDAATATASTHSTRSRWYGRLRCMLPCL